MFSYAFIHFKMVSVLLNWFGFALSGFFPFISLVRKLQTCCFILSLSIFFFTRKKKASKNLSLIKGSLFRVYEHFKKMFPAFTEAL